MRLTYGVSTGKNSKGYAYYFCQSRINGGDCTQRINMRPELIEDAIQRHYVEQPIELSAQQVERRTAAIRSLVAVSQTAVAQVQQAKTALIGKLKSQQQRLLRMYAEEGDGISPDAFRDERARMQAEIAAAEQSLAETTQRLQLDAEQLTMALELAQDVAAVYRGADESTKRGFNQAFFKKVYVMPEWEVPATPPKARVTSAALTEPYAVLLSDGLAEGIEAELAGLQHAGTNTEGDRDGSPSEVSIFVKLAEGEGFEPSVQGLPAQRFSRPPDSTTLAPLRGCGTTG